MEDEIDNLPQGGIEPVQPEPQNDDADDLDYYDPDEDNVEAEADATEGSTDEADEGQEAAADENADDEAKPADDAKAPKDDVVITLQTGEAVPLSELKAGYMKDADYRRKTSQIAETRNAVLAEANRVQSVTETFKDFLAQFVPDEPDISLAYSNPAHYTAQKAAHDKALGEIQRLVALGNEAAAAKGKVEQVDRQKVLSEENERLAARFPMTKNTKGREAFFANATTAAKELGFSDEELASATDHRLYGLAYWAKQGIEAHAARAKAKEKVANVPPVAAPQKRVMQQARPKLKSRYSSVSEAAADWDD